MARVFTTSSGITGVIPYEMLTQRPPHAWADGPCPLPVSARFQVLTPVREPGAHRRPHPVPGHSVCEETAGIRHLTDAESIEARVL